MRPSKLEAWVLAVLDQVDQGQANEDARVELKAAWPDDPAKAARRIAGHANAARGESILWIIGVDQERGAVPAPAVDLAQWFPRVQAQFDGIAPSLTDLVVPHHAGAVVALHFDTTRAPFVVKNAVHGGAVTLEVPWREGTRVRSATRADLLKLLVPKISLPRVEPVHASVKGSIERYGSGEDEVQTRWDLEFALYVEPCNEARVVFPRHRAALWFRLPDYNKRKFVRAVRILPPSVPVEERSNSIFYAKEDEHLPESHTIRASLYEAIVEGPGQLRVVGTARTPGKQEFVMKPLTVGVRISPVGSEGYLELDFRLFPVPLSFGELKGSWSSMRIR